MVVITNGVVTLDVRERTATLHAMEVTYGN
jgi:hypothetical protein